MKDKDGIKKRMLKEGFSIIYEYDDPPGELYPDHDHPRDQLLVVLKGSMEVKMSGKTSVVREGEEIFFPAKVVHSAKIGPEGCSYIDGERPTDLGRVK